MTVSAWFIFTQVSVTLCFCAEVVGTAIILFIWIKTGGLQTAPKDKNKKRESINMLQTAVGITCVTGKVPAHSDFCVTGCSPSMSLRMA